MSLPASQTPIFQAPIPMKSRPVSRGWLRSAACLAVAALAVALAPNPAAAQANPNPPERMTYQGFLVDGNGVALGNTAPKNYDVIFRIYNHETQSAPANLLWAEQQTVTVDKGYFSVLLGEGAASDGKPANQKLSDAFKGADASDRFVGITVLGIGPGGANADILPRLRMLTSPYAYLANQAIKVVRTDNGDDLLTASGNVVSVSGSVNATSFTGAGTGLTGVAKLAGGNTFAGDQIFNNLSLFQVGSFSSGSTYATIATAGGNQYKAGLRLRHFNNNWGWTIESDETVNALKLIAHQNSGVGSTRFSIGYGGRADFFGSVGVAGNNYIDLGTGVTKQTDAGRIGYGTFIANSLNIVGGGTTGSNRRLDIWNEGGAFFNGAVNAPSFSGNLNADQLASGTVPIARIPSNVHRDGNPLTVFSWGIRTRYSSTRYADWWRDVRSMRFELGGNNVHNDSASAVRYVVYDGDSNWDFSSDRKLKKDIQDAEPVLERALQVQVRRYRWKDEADDAKLKLGVIAQEVQPLFPDMVGESSNKDGTETSLTVGYGDFAVIAIKAIQELHARHEAEKAAMESELAILKAQMAEVRAQMKEVLQASQELRGQLDRAKATASVGR